MRPTILTNAGTYFNFLNPEASHIDIDTIAHALANICRFTGHTTSFYSVAQHSVLVSYLVAPEHALAGLLHDAAEAFLGDVASPLKQLLPDYKAIEARVEASVLARFGFPTTLSDAVRVADQLALALALEQRDIMPPHDDTWPCQSLLDNAPKAIREINISPETPAIARRVFKARFQALYWAALAPPCGLNDIANAAYTPRSQP
jgi:hypothetical protein